MLKRPAGAAMLHIVGDRLVHEHGVDVFEEGFDRGRLGFSSRGGETQGSRRCLRRRRRRRRRKMKKRKGVVD